MLSSRVLSRVGQNHLYTVYARYKGRKISKNAGIYGAYIQFKPTLILSHVFTRSVQPEAALIATYD